MHDLRNFSLGSMTSCGAALRRIGAGAESMEEVADHIVRYFHERFVDPGTGEPSLVLARFFKTIDYASLDAGLQRAARDVLARWRPRGSVDRFGPEIPRPNLKCLTLLATAGQRPEWNDRTRSARHRVIPLSSPGIVARFPMISRLITQCGFDLAVLLMPGRDILVDMEQRTFNVFHVPDAVGSPYVPDQEEFVVPHGVHSVVGFGGVLPPADLFAIILFSRQPIGRDTANMFAPLALSVKLALLPFTAGTASR